MTTHAAGSLTLPIIFRTPSHPCRSPSGWGRSGTLVWGCDRNHLGWSEVRGPPHPAPWRTMQNFNHMMTSSNGDIFRVSGLLCGEFTGLTKASDADLWWFLWSPPEYTVVQTSWWFETPSRPLWRHRNEMICTWNLWLHRMKFHWTVFKKWAEPRFEMIICGITTFD